MPPKKRYSTRRSPVEQLQIRLVHLGGCVQRWSKAAASKLAMRNSAQFFVAVVEQFADRFLVAN